MNAGDSGEKKRRKTMETKAKTFTEILAAIGGAIVSFFCGLPPIMWVLLAVMTIDYLTGIFCGLMGRSKKTETGGLSSSAAFKGLLKKALIILVVLLAALLDKAVTMGTGVAFEAVAGATCLWFIASEGFSIIENVASMGVPIPGILKQALEIMRKKGEAPEEKKAEEQQPEQAEK
jgi:toxin secretion/phage lysis holin